MGAGTRRAGPRRHGAPGRRAKSRLASWSREDRQGQQVDASSVGFPPFLPHPCPASPCLPDRSGCGSWTGLLALQARGEAARHAGLQCGGGLLRGPLQAWQSTAAWDGCSERGGGGREQGSAVKPRCMKPARKLLCCDTLVRPSCSLPTPTHPGALRPQVPQHPAGTVRGRVGGDGRAGRGGARQGAGGYTGSARQGGGQSRSLQYSATAAQPLTSPTRPTAAVPARHRDGTAKIADVGMARILARDYVTGVVGTLAW